MYGIDEERFAAGAPSVSGPRGSGARAEDDRTRPRARRRAREDAAARERPRVLHADGDVVVELVAQQGREGVVRVRALSAEGRRAARQQAQLLAALEVDGLRAVPTVHALEDDGYLRESAPVLARRGGRRADHDGTPPTAERLALGQVRDDLEALLDALHGRGWLLGARGPSTLGLRADGTAVLLDLRGMRRGEDALDQLTDRRWIDATLQDRDRTLRRRIDLDRAVQPAGGGLVGRDVAGAVEDGAPVARGVAPGATADLEDEPRGISVPDWADDSEVGDGAIAMGGAGEKGGATSSGRRVRPRPAPRAVSVAPRRRGRRGLGTRPVRAVRGLIADPVTRRIALISGASVLAAGLVLGAGGWLLTDGPRVEETASGVESSPAPGEGAPGSGAEDAGAGDAGPEAEDGIAAGDAAAAAVTIEEPWALGAEIAGARHAYVTGVSDYSPTLPGSAARADDDAVRAAYSGRSVTGGGPVVHDAELLEIDLDAGTASLQLETSTEAARVTDEAGATTEVAATAPGTVILDLAWDGREWLITTVREPTA